MSDTILVTYATRYGSTREVAETVAEVLTTAAIDVRLESVGDVGDADVGGCAAVVVGTPFYLGSPLKEVTAFLERHEATLRQKPVALFALGPVRADDDLAAARAQLDGMTAKHPWLKPVAATMFVGKYDPTHLRLRDRLVTLPPASPLHAVEAHDDRDWESIRAWAAALPNLLAVVPAGSRAARS